MSYPFESRLGEQLYRLLPEVYRQKPESYRQTPGKLAGQARGESRNDDLAKYLDAHGHLLDLIHATLKQQLRDIFPESSQDWLLPYFAELLAANIVSPDAKGKHAEIAHAISWRQRKGTLRCAEEIAEAVGEVEVEIQEGWQRVAMTPRIGTVLMPSSARDSTLHLDMTLTAEAILHPDLPAVMVDMRRISRAVAASAANPAARVARFGGVKQTWRQADHHGVPCFAGSFDDVSRRTVDMRTPTSIRGHFHHKRLLAYTPPPVGFFSLGPLHLEWSKRNDEAYEHIIEEKMENGVVTIRNLSSRIIEITNDVTLGPGGVYKIEGLRFTASLTVGAGGRLELHRVEAGRMEVSSASTDEPVLTAVDCLFQTLSVGNGYAVLDNCTILGDAFFSVINAKNCIFMDIIGSAISGQLSYCRIHETAPLSPDKMVTKNCTFDEPRFFKHQTELTSRAVLAPNGPKSVYAGADDGGEMGYFHSGREDNPVVIRGDFTGGDSLFLKTDGGFPLRDLIFLGSVEVNNGNLTLVRTAIFSLRVNTALQSDNRGQVIPSVDARDCLFDNISATFGLARLEYCTVMKKADCKHLQASDCLFAGSIVNVQKMKPAQEVPSLLNCIRYSGIIPEALPPETLRSFRLIDTDNKLILGTNTSEVPIFVTFAYCQEKKLHTRSTLFGEPGYGVLSSIAPDAIRFGAEDGGEIGAYHHRFYSLKQDATLEKMREFLPVGIEPVLIQDTRLLYVLPELLTADNPT
jgi:hypothetical protein